MARAGVASASAHPDSIKGLAQSIAKPAYRRLLTAEPLLRRAVPVLIIAFLATICVGAVVQVLDQRRQTLNTMVISLEAVADLAAERLQQPLKQPNDAVERPQEVLARALPPWATGVGRHFLLTNAEGVVAAATPATDATIGRRLIDLLGPTQPLTTFGAGAGVLEITLPDDTRALATVRMLNAPFGQIAVVQSRDAALASWRSLTTLTITLSATTGFVVLILGFAFHWQATRAREADLIYETVRSRIDTALNRGRCGLWDWDLARGRIFWSQSMFDILGLEAKDNLLPFGDVSALVHPDDVQLYELATELADAKMTVHRPRLPHASRRRPLGLAARPLRTGAPARRAGPASDRHRRRHHRAEEPGRKDGRRRHAPARRHRDHSGSLRAVGCRQSAGAVQFEFPGAAQPARRGDHGRRLLRVGGRGRQQAGGAQQDRHRRAERSRRAHLRGAARGRPLAAHQRAAHQGRRLCVGRHRHHRAQDPRGKAGRQREAPDGDRSPTCAPRSSG